MSLTINWTAVIFLLFLHPAILVADTIYKSISEDGNVTYSTTPPQNSERSTSIDITPPPSEEDIKAAQSRQERNKKAAETLDENRKKRNEITAEENRLKRENQKQLQQQQQAEENNDNQGYGYPYYRQRHPGVIRPPAHRPVQLPVR